MFKQLKMRAAILLLPLIFLSFGCASTGQMYDSPNTKLDTVKAQRFDTGKMWTFEDAPREYWKSEYGFEPSDEWLDDVRMSALKFANWCSSSFVSEDGLVMTNHHCIDFVSNRIQKEGEDIKKNGFYAPTLDDERKINGVFVRQLVLIEDVTDEVKNVINSQTERDAIIEAKKAKIEEIETKYNDETGLECNVVELYHGGKYSLYGYRRYSDVRAVYFNESDVGLYGGDPDNFTYPRYNPDFAFVRVYDDNGKPLKTDHFFKFSLEGPKIGEPIFVIGNPGSTQRLKTVAQLEYMRDFGYRNASFILNRTLQNLYEMMNEYPDRASEFEGMIFMVANSAKVMKGRVEGLNDPMFITRKKAFEKDFKTAVMNDPALNEKYGHIWDAIESTRNEMRQFAGQLAAYNINPRTSPALFSVAGKLVDLAEQLQLPEDQRQDQYKGDNLETTIASIFPKRYDEAMQTKQLKMNADYLAMNLGADNELVMKLYGGKSGNAAVEYLLSNTKIGNAEAVKELASKGSEAILNSGDPLIYFVLNTKDQLNDYQARAQEINSTESVLENELGQALYEVYGTSIPPDATFTLRINDGVMKSYDYNGTIAPEFTTFYGMYNRYYSHQKKYPWDLPERWLNLNEDFNLETPFNFISTNDIIGGSSGSAVINKNKEIVGIAFDGNMESIAGDFLYDTKANRMVSVASQGIVEILSDLLKCTRLANEIKAGKIVE